MSTRRLFFFLALNNVSAVSFSKFRRPTEMRKKFRLCTKLWRPKNSGSTLISPPGHGACSRCLFSTSVDTLFTKDQRKWCYALTMSTHTHIRRCISIWYLCALRTALALRGHDRFLSVAVCLFFDVFSDVCECTKSNSMPNLINPVFKKSSTLWGFKNHVLLYLFFIRSSVKSFVCRFVSVSSWKEPVSSGPEINIVSVSLLFCLWCITGAGTYQIESTYGCFLNQSVS